ncbi:MAG TPA: FAD/NAD(P)-binding protein [Candidatus Babeliales bacterium]|nr:FAD/NAD(P)-binding protein [Candidatus Babeliales bacterium]
MKRLFFIITYLLIAQATYSYTEAPGYTQHEVDADWLIVGAGPAGIAAIGILLDIGVPPQRLTWIDPEFNVGRMGAYYDYVTSNNATHEFIAFINACHSFQQCPAETVHKLNSLNPLAFDNLQVVIDPLRDITAYLCTQIRAIQNSMESLYFTNDNWYITTCSGESVSAHHVILATGSHPKTIDYEQHKIISLDLALNPYNLERLVTSDDIVGVVGGSHSAIMLLKFLSELPFPVKHIYNLYNSPLIYTIDKGDYKINALDGLKGMTAQWAQEVLEKNPPANLTRIQSSPEALKATIELCSKIIYAIGFERNNLPEINDTTPITATEAGIIAPRLFGMGFAFPEKITTYEGKEGYRVGLRSFMDYAQRMIPVWYNADNNCLRGQSEIEHIQKRLYRLLECADIFTISLL